MKTPEELADLSLTVLNNEAIREVFAGMKVSSGRRQVFHRYLKDSLTTEEVEAMRLWVEACMGLSSPSSRFYPAYRLSAMPPILEGFRATPKPKLDPLPTLQADKSFMAAFRYSYEGPPRWKPAPEQRKIMTFYCKKLGLHLNAEERETLRLQFDAAHRGSQQ